jgi:hypothetical protein
MIVEAVGYKPWENAIRMKLNNNKPLHIKVKMVRWDDFQGLDMSNPHQIPDINISLNCGYTP